MVEKLILGRRGSGYLRQPCLGKPPLSNSAISAAESSFSFPNKDKATQLREKKVEKKQGKKKAQIFGFLNKERNFKEKCTYS